MEDKTLGRMLRLLDTLPTDEELRGVFSSASEQYKSDLKKNMTLEKAKLQAAWVGVVYKQKRKATFMTKKTFAKFFGVLRQNHLLLWKTQEDAERGLSELKSFFIDTNGDLSAIQCRENVVDSENKGESDQCDQWANGKRYELQLGMSTHQHSASAHYDQRWLAFERQDVCESFIDAVKVAAGHLDKSKLEATKSSYGFSYSSGV
jgi:hypothetical protein